MECQSCWSDSRGNLLLVNTSISMSFPLPILNIGFDIVPLVRKYTAYPDDPWLLLLNFICRYDGQRAQIHMLHDGAIRIFTRDSGDATGRFPDVINIVREAAGKDLKSFVIDAEVGLCVC